MNTGRVEVYYNSTWGTVCDDGWSLNNAAVVCRELGFPGAISYSCCAAFGQGSGHIWLDDVQCTGRESSLSSCFHRNRRRPFLYYQYRCSHSQDAGVFCQCEYIYIYIILHDITVECLYTVINGTLGPFILST